jgi:branched-chain amino acid transport system ATP-binding protein
VKPKSGCITLDGRQITNRRADDLVRLGIAMVPEGRRLFPRMTVRQNLLLGAYTLKNHGEIEARLDRVLTTFPRLKGKQKQMAGTLSGGEQQMTAIGRGLMANPRILLVDEMSLGLAPLLVSEMFDLMRKVREQGITILLVEQNVEEALGIADRAYVLQTGRVVMSGSPAELRDSEEVRKAYLGL